MAGVAAAVTGLDQWTKSWAQASLTPGQPRHLVGSLYLALTYNRGAAFSLGSGAAPLIEAVAVALALAVLWVSGRLAHRSGSAVTLAGVGLVGGGALSNLADRFIRQDHGAVIDFVQLVSWWPVFNLADAAITVGAVLVAGRAVVSACAKEAPSCVTGPRAGTNSP